MAGSYFVELIKSLLPAERLAFERFVATGMWPEHKKNTALVLSLIRIVLQAAPDFSPKKLDKNQVYHLLFPQKPLVEGKLEKLMVEASRLLKSFLLHHAYFQEANQTRHQLDWTAVLQERNLHHWHQQTLLKLQKTHTKQVAKNTEYFSDQFRIEFAVHQHETNHNRLKGDLNVPQVLQSLDIYYHLTRLELLNLFLLQRKVTNLETSEPMRSAVQSLHMPESSLHESPILLISYRIFQLLQQETISVEAFRALSHLLHTHERSILPEMLQQFYTYLRNFCTILINAGADELLPIYHQLQRDNLERGYLYYEGDKISASAYISVATGAIRAHEFDWAQAFIESHKGRVIGDNDSHDLYKLNLAQHRFAIGQHEDALDLIAPTFEYLNYTLVARRLELKILFELKSELLPYKAGAFKIFITRASQKFMPPSIRRPNGDFVNLLIQMINSKPGDRNRSHRLLQRVQAKPHTAEREWLLEKSGKLR